MAWILHIDAKEGDPLLLGLQMNVIIGSDSKVLFVIVILILLLMFMFVMPARGQDVPSDSRLERGEAVTWRLGSGVRAVKALNPLVNGKIVRRSGITRGAAFSIRMDQTAAEIEGGRR